MAEIKLSSYQQLLGQMAAKLRAETDLTDLSPGSILLTILEAAASGDFAVEGKLLQLLNLRNIDKTKGIDLENLAEEMGLSPKRLGSAPANAALQVKETSFVKVKSNVYAGSTAPTAGDTVIKIVDGSDFDAAGSIFIGRNTSTSEAVAYLSLTNTGSYWEINLASPLSKDHLVGEEVVMAQGGDRNIPAGTIALVPASAGTPGILFRTIADFIMADGEDTVSNIPAVAVDPGSTGNVGRNKIRDFTGAPWTTASVSNPDPATGGRDSETDPELRQRIKDHVHELGKGTERAVIRAVIGVNDDEEGKRVVSAFLRKPTSNDEIGILFIDDGTGFAPSFSGVGEEVIVTSATGVENFFQLQKWPLVKAQTASIAVEPFALSGGENLYVEVDGQFEQRAIPGTSYRTPGVVSAQEVAEAINKTFTSVEARAKDGRLFLTATSDDPDWVRVGVATSGSDSNVAFRFPTRRAYTIRLYKNDKLLEKNGQEAFVQSIPNSAWPVFSSTESLQLKIDGIDSPLVTFTDLDFATLTTSSTILGATVSDWVTMVNARFIGITAVARDDGTFIIKSNRGKSTSAKIEVIAGTLATKMFPANSKSEGKGPEFTLNRLLGQIQLTDKLAAGDELKAGTVNTRGFAVSSAQANFNLPLTLGRAAELVIAADYPFTSVTVLQANLLTFTSPASGVLRIAGAVGQFSNVKENDGAHLYNLPRNGLLKVKSVASNGSSVDLFDPDPQVGTATLDGVSRKLTFFRTEGLAQLITLPIGTAVTGNDIVTSINTQLLGASAEKLDTSAIKISTARFDSAGALSILSVAGSAVNLVIAEGTYQSNDAHTAAVESDDLSGIPTNKFLVDNTGEDITAPYTDLKVTTAPFVFEYANRPVMTYLGAAAGFIRQPASRQSTSYLVLRDEKPFQTVGLSEDMRATALSGVEFGQADNMVFLIDNDSAKKTFDIPMYVDGTIAGPSVPNTQQFDVADMSGALLGSSSRWIGHRFEDYRVWMQAKNALPFSSPNSQIKFVAVPFGPNGQRIRVGTFYPTTPNQQAQASFSVDAANDLISIILQLASDVERSINLQPNVPVYVDVSGSGPYTEKVTFVSPVDLSQVVPGDIVSLDDPGFASNNRKQMLIQSVSNLADFSRAYEFRKETIDSDVNGNTMVTFGTTPADTVRVGDQVRLVGYTKQVQQVYDQVAGTVDTVAANQITVLADDNYTQTGGQFKIGPNTFTYTSYTPGTKTFAGVTPNPVGPVNPTDLLTQYKNEIVVDVGAGFATGGGSFTANAQTFTYTAYDASTGTFTGILPDPVGIVIPGNYVSQTTSGATRAITAVGTQTSVTIASPGFPDGSGIDLELTHKALSASSVPTFTVAPGDRVQVGGQILKVTAILAPDEWDVDLPFTFTGLLSGTVSRLNVVGLSQTAGTTETVIMASNQGVRMFEIPLAGNDANSLVDIINNTAGVNDLVFAANATGSTGAGFVITSTADELGDGNSYVQLKNGESFVYSTLSTSPAIRVKEPFEVSPEIGDKVKFIPATAENIYDHFSKKQISGLTVAAEVNLVDSGRKVQVSSKTPGGLGQVFAVGGKASGLNILNVRGSAQEVSNTRAQIELDKSAADLLSPGHYVKLYQAGRARKEWAVSDPASGTSLEIQIVTTGKGRFILGTPFVSLMSYTHTGSVQWLVRRLGRGRIRFEVLAGTATIPAALKAEDWVLVGNGDSYAGQTPAQVFSSANQGWFQVRETDNATYFDVEAAGVEEFVTTSSAPFIFTPYHSARPGDQIVIGPDTPLSTANKGTYLIVDVPSTTQVDYLNDDVEVQAPTTFGSATAADSLRILDQGYTTYRRVVMTAPKPNDPTNRSLLVVSPGYDIALLNEGQGAKISLPNRLGFGTDPVPGMSGYQFWTGLKRKVQRTLDGYEPNAASFEGVRAAGVPIEAREPQIQRISMQIKVKTAKGVSLQSISDTIKSAIAGYVNSLGLGQDVVISEVIRLVQGVAGVDACTFSDPVPATERITVSSNAISRISTNDIILN